MLKQYLKKISKIKVELIETKLIDWKILNLVIFWTTIPEDLVKYKIVFLKNMLEKTNKLIKIIEEINNDSKINKNNKKIIEKEIFVKLKKIEFLKKIYDVEANKLDSNYKIQEELEDYDYYNKIFYWFTKENLSEEIVILENKDLNTFISKDNLIKLLEFSKTLIPELKWNFWSFAGLSHDDWILNIPDEKKYLGAPWGYNIKRVIAIFFHEMTHFFRYLNWKNNLWFHYIFSDYDDLEEGITTYNEYYYWNKIIDYWKYNAYYDKCYQILLKNISEEEKKEEIYQVLKNKWFNKQKTDILYTRFYRYTKIWSNKLFLKELIYNNAYKNVSKLLEENPETRKKIMVWNIWLYELENNLIKNSKNFEELEYFNIMVEKIKNIIK